MINVLITRTAEQSAETVNLFSAAGLSPYCLPMIETLPISAEFKYTEYDYCIFTSPAAVKFFVSNGKRLGVGRYIAVGKKTALALNSALSVDMADIIVPQNFYMADIAKILDTQDLRGKKILAAGAKVRVTDMHDFFSKRGALYDAPATYVTSPIVYDDGVADEFLLRYKIDVVTFFSPSAVNAFFRQIKQPLKAKIAVIGTTTSAALPAGYTAIMPKEQTAESMATSVAGASARL